MPWSIRELMLRGNRDRNRLIAGQLRKFGKITCDTCGYALGDYHSLNRGSYWRCKNGHVTPWDVVIRQARAAGVTFS